MHSLDRADLLFEPLRHLGGEYGVPVVVAPEPRREEPSQANHHHRAPRLLLVLLGRRVGELVADATDDGAVLAEHARPGVPILGVEPTHGPPSSPVLPKLINRFARLKRKLPKALSQIP